MQFDRLQKILNRLANREEGPRAQVYWQILPAPDDTVTLTLVSDQEFRAWRWSNEWVPCGTITCSVRHWNCELINDFYRRDEALTARLGWMPEGETPAALRTDDDLVTSVGHPVAVEYEADLSEALGFLLEKGLKPLWCEEANPLPAPELELVSPSGTSYEPDPHVRRCVLLTSADERRACQWCY